MIHLSLIYQSVAIYMENGKRRGFACHKRGHHPQFGISRAIRVPLWNYGRHSQILEDVCGQIEGALVSNHPIVVFCSPFQHWLPLPICSMYDIFTYKTGRFCSGKCWYIFQHHGAYGIEIHDFADFAVQFFEEQLSGGWCGSPFLRHSYEITVLN